MREGGGAGVGLKREADCRQAAQRQQQAQRLESQEMQWYCGPNEPQGQGQRKDKGGGRLQSCGGNAGGQGDEGEDAGGNRALDGEQDGQQTPRPAATAQDMAADTFRLGVLFFELFCPFRSAEEKDRAMRDLRHRVLPQRMLLEWPKEAAFCLWLLHPDPLSRPSARDILGSELVREGRGAARERKRMAWVIEREAECVVLLGFLRRVLQAEEQASRELRLRVDGLVGDIHEVERRRQRLHPQPSSNNNNNNAAASPAACALTLAPANPALSGGAGPATTPLQQHRHHHHHHHHHQQQRFPLHHPVHAGPGARPWQKLQHPQNGRPMQQQQQPMGPAVGGRQGSSTDGVLGQHQPAFLVAGRRGARPGEDDSQEGASSHRQSSAGGATGSVGASGRGGWRPPTGGRPQGAEEAPQRLLPWGEDGGEAREDGRLGLDAWGDEQRLGGSRKRRRGGRSQRDRAEQRVEQEEEEAEAHGEEDAGEEDEGDAEEGSEEELGRDARSAGLGEGQGEDGPLGQPALIPRHSEDPLRSPVLAMPGAGREGGGGGGGAAGQEGEGELVWNRSGGEREHKCARVMQNFERLEEVYFSMRWRIGAAAAAAPAPPLPAPGPGQLNQQQRRQQGSGSRLGYATGGSGGAEEGGSSVQLDGRQGAWEGVQDRTQGASTGAGVGRGPLALDPRDRRGSTAMGQGAAADPFPLLSVAPQAVGSMRLAEGRRSGSSMVDHHDWLGGFFDSLCKFARYSRFEVRATLRHGDMVNSAGMVCSLSFDRDNEFFATAGVCKRIRIFECDVVLGEQDTVDIHYPVVEMACRSKLSSVAWNSYIKGYIASSDYEGVVQLWDANTTQSLVEYLEHDKRVWSVDFCRADPTRLASASDDATVKLWSINQEQSTATIRTRANVCSVQFASGSSHLLALGSADYHAYCYDLRRLDAPLCTLGGHARAVSYVKFADNSTLVSASTDNTLRIWDLNKACANTRGAEHPAAAQDPSTNPCVLVSTGHTNEKNFVGLSVVDGYIACGSETNEVFTYHRTLPMPMARHKFGGVDPVTGGDSEEDAGQFVSSVCWRGNSQQLLAANSMGNIKLLEMV